MVGVAAVLCSNDSVLVLCGLEQNVVRNSIMKSGGAVWFRCNKVMEAWWFLGDVTEIRSSVPDLVLVWVVWQLLKIQSPKWLPYVMAFSFKQL